MVNGILYQKLLEKKKIIIYFSRFYSKKRKEKFKFGIIIGTRSYIKLMYDDAFNHVGSC